VQGSTGAKLHQEHRGTRPDAVIVTSKEKTYSELLAVVTRRDDSQLLGLGSWLRKFRNTTNGNLLLEVAKESTKSAEAMRDVDALTKKSDIGAAYARQYDFDDGKVKVRSIRPGYSKSQIAVISFPITLGNVVIKKGEFC